MISNGIAIAAGATTGFFVIVAPLFHFIADNAAAITAALN